MNIYASLLSADMNNIEKEIDSIEPFVDGFHLDFMDGIFVQAFCMEFYLIDKVWQRTRKRIEVHLMCNDPARYIHEISDKGAEAVIAHYEAINDITSRMEITAEARKCRIELGIAYNPGTYFAEIIGDFTQIMNVYPGKGGQKFIEQPLEKISSRRYIEQIFPSARHEIFSVDGGVNTNTAKKAKQAGADAVIVGSALFRAKNRKSLITRLRNI